MELRIQLQGDILKKIKSAGEDSKQTFQDAMRDASTLVMEATIKEAPASTGILRKSIKREFSDNGLKAAIYPTVDYGVFLHGPFDGSRERSAPFTIPAKEAMEGGSLYRWAKKKGMNPWAVRGAIKKKGMKLNPFMKTAAGESESGVREIFLAAINRVATNLGD